MIMQWTKIQLDEEWFVIYETRLGVFCGACASTREQEAIAREEADKHVAALAKERLRSETG